MRHDVVLQPRMSLPPLVRLMAVVCNGIRETTRTTACGRLLPFTNATFWFGERPLIGESGHWDASSKSHVYDIRERQQRVVCGHSRTSAFGQERSLVLLFQRTTIRDRPTFM